MLSSVQEGICLRAAVWLLILPQLLVLVSSCFNRLAHAASALWLQPYHLPKRVIRGRNHSSSDCQKHSGSQEAAMPALPRQVKPTAPVLGQVTSGVLGVMQG